VNAVLIHERLDLKLLENFMTAVWGCFSSLRMWIWREKFSV